MSSSQAAAWLGQAQDPRIWLNSAGEFSEEAILTQSRRKIIREHSPLADFTIRQKLILCGLYLSKFDSAGLKNLGFDSFAEAYNVIGYALGARPASIKNYRDEFDPLFPNQRMGWHKRPVRDHCREIYEQFKVLDLEDFGGLVKSFFGYDERSGVETLKMERAEDGISAFAQRLVTGLAAERYFETVYPSIPEFRGLSAENTTRFGCGYDFRLRQAAKRDDFLAVEVKGLKDLTGSLSMTSKEYEVASSLRARFFLFVVKNFREASLFVRLGIQEDRENYNSGFLVHERLVQPRSELRGPKGPEQRQSPTDSTCWPFAARQGRLRWPRRNPTEKDLTTATIVRGRPLICRTPLGLRSCQTCPPNHQSRRSGRTLCEARQGLRPPSRMQHQFRHRPNPLRAPCYRRQWHLEGFQLRGAFSPPLEDAGRFACAPPICKRTAARQRMQAFS
jgi:Protein NO VEIN, C-terminal